MKRILVLIVTILFLGAGCGSSSSGDNSTPSGSPSATAKRFEAKPMSFNDAGSSASALLTREEGGTLRVTLADGSTATLTIPAGALEQRTFVALIPIASADGVGVRMEPSGLWLDIDATLSFSRTRGTVVSRIGAAREADLFVASPADRSSIRIARLRPFLVIDTPLEISSPGLEWERDIAPGLQAPSSDPRGDDADEFDVAAYYFENPRTDDPQRGQQENEQVRTGAGRSVPALETKCDDRTSAAASRVADTATTAGSKAVNKPTCVKRVLSVTASFEGTMSGEGLTINFAETIDGYGFVIATTDGATSEIPLEGVAEGVEKLASLMATGVVWGFGTYAGLSVPPPSPDACSMSPLQSGRMNVTATLTAISELSLRMTPSGQFMMNCGEFGTYPAPPMFWDLLGEFGLSIPIVLSVPDGQNSVRTLGELIQVASQDVRTSTDGTVAVSESDMTLSISLVVGVFWSRADRCDLTPEEKAKGPEYEKMMCGSGPA